MPRATAPEIYSQLDRIQHDIRNAQAKLIELRRMIGTIELPKNRAPHACPVCGLEREGPRSLAEHIAHVHGVET